MQGNIAKSVERRSIVQTDEHYAYRGIGRANYFHLPINHSQEQYSFHGVTTNEIESVWAIMKRGYKGTYHHWSKKHLHRYLNEFSFRLTKGKCATRSIERIGALISNSTDRRLTYHNLLK